MRLWMSAVALLELELEFELPRASVPSHLERVDTPTGAYNLLIAAQARRDGASLGIRNARQFAWVTGLVVEDWGGVNTAAADGTGRRGFRQRNRARLGPRHYPLRPARRAI